MSQRKDPLTIEQILAWVLDHRARTGKYPSRLAGPVLAAPGENWLAIDTALYAGNRGLRGGDSLSRLIKRGKGKQEQTLARNKLGIEWPEG